MEIKELYLKLNELEGKTVTLNGWIRNHRKQKEFGFIDLHDGTCFKSVQIIYTNELKEFDTISKYRVGSCISVTGVLSASVGSGQSYEVKATSVTLLGDCPEDYPIQPKRHTREFLREQAYLRPRTNLFNAVFRVRSVAAFAIHSYFQERNYIYVHTPLITTTDCEGSDQMFKITTLNMDKLPYKDKLVDYSKDLFGKKAFVTGSGQLHGEAYAMAFKNIYTFGPTFRTENSNTKTHANEFWMIEPEIAFCDLNGLMDVEEEMLKYVIKYVMDRCKDELEFFDKFVENGLIDKLKDVLDKKAVRIKHEDAIKLMLDSKDTFEVKPEYGEDIAKEHEKWLTTHFNGPVFLTDWPKDIKAWYMKVNEDNSTVAAVDFLVPQAGELMGGSQREENYDKLIQRMKELNVDIEPVEWFTNLRKYGTCVHSGFGMGFERLIIYLTGVENIRDVIPFPRTPGNCEY